MKSWSKWFADRVDDRKFEEMRNFWPFRWEPRDGSQIPVSTPFMDHMRARTAKTRSEINSYARKSPTKLNESVRSFMRDLSDLI